MTTRPSVRSGLRRGAFVFACVMALALVDLVQHGTDVEHWGLWSDLSLMTGAAMASWLLAKRYREERKLLWLMLSFGTAGWALGQLAWTVQVHAFGNDTWPSWSGIGFLLWPLMSISAVFVHTRSFERSTKMVFFVESALLAVAVWFTVWELVVRPATASWSRSAVVHLLSLTFPLADILMASVMLLMLLVDVSQTRIAFFLCAVSLAVGDIVFCAVAPRSTASYLVAYPFLAMAFVVASAASGLQGGGAVRPSRRRKLNLFVVNIPVLVAIGVAMFRYIIQSHKASVVSAVIVGITGLLICANQLASWYRASDLAGSLEHNVDRLTVVEGELRALLDDLPAAVVVLDRAGRIRDANARALDITGRTKDQLLGRTFVSVVPEEYRQMLADSYVELFQGGRMINPVFAIRHPNGNEVILEADVHGPVRDPNRVVLALRDVTFRNQEAVKLERARERFRMAFHGAPTGMALATSDSAVLLDVNQSLADMLGYTIDELKGLTVEEITHPDDWMRSDGFTTKSVDGVDAFRLEKRYVRRDGGVVWARTWVSLLDDGEGGSIAIAHVEDVTEQRHSKERLEWAATHDELTRLPNRFRFLEQLGSHLETSVPGAVAVLFIDIDNFKVINDSLGHGVGDQLLRGMSERLRAVVRDRDLLGRFGGDEFIVMLRDIGMALSPVEIAERLRAEIALPLVVDGAELFVTASIGIAVADRPGVTTTELLRDADAAMYRAKARGRDCVEVFSPGSHDASVLTLRTTNELRRGLERGEIMPYYQPIVNLVDGHLVGFEVLARWRHPDRGLLGPEQFLPMAEETGLIGEVGATVLRSSLSQLGLWRESMPHFEQLSMSVNVSVRQLMSKHLHETVADALAETGVPANALWLEITETALMSDVKQATVALRELRNLGLHLAVDDFGTGYSSLTYLKRFPVESIKVDRSFVSGLGIDQEDTTIVEAVVKLGHSLGLQVVAEGVETPLQLSRLREIGCDRGQGYLFGRPRPADLIATEYALTSSP